MISENALKLLKGIKKDGDMGCLDKFNKSLRVDLVKELLDKGFINYSGKITEKGVQIIIE